MFQVSSTTEIVQFSYKRCQIVEIIRMHVLKVAWIGKDRQGNLPDSSWPKEVRSACRLTMFDHVWPGLQIFSTTFGYEKHEKPARSPTFVTGSVAGWFIVFEHVMNHSPCHPNKTYFHSNPLVPLVPLVPLSSIYIELWAKTSPSIFGISQHRVFFGVLASVVPTGASSTWRFSEKFQVSQHAMRVAVVCYALVLRSAALRDEISRFEPLELEVGKDRGLELWFGLPQKMMDFLRIEPTTAHSWHRTCDHLWFDFCPLMGIVCARRKSGVSFAMPTFYRRLRYICFWPPFLVDLFSNI